MVDQSTATSADEARARRRAQNLAATAKLRESWPYQAGIRYASGENQTLDIYLPRGEPVGPTLVFLVGGGFRNGDPGSVGHHALPYIEAGGIFVSLGYRLAPNARFPESAADVEAGLHFLLPEVERRGGDPERLYLSGHSAGASLAAEVALRSRDEVASGLQGLVLISGIYDLAFFTDEVVDRNSPRYVPDLIAAIDHAPPHTVVVAADADLPAAQTGAVALTDALRARGASVEHFTEADADHFQAVRGFITPGDIVAERVKAMMGLPLRAKEPAASR